MRKKKFIDGCLLNFYSLNSYKSETLNPFVFFLLSFVLLFLPPLATGRVDIPPALWMNAPCGGMKSGASARTFMNACGWLRRSWSLNPLWKAGRLQACWGVWREGRRTRTRLNPLWKAGRLQGKMQFELRRKAYIQRLNPLWKAGRLQVL